MVTSEQAAREQIDAVESLATKVVDGVHRKPDYVESGVPFITGVRNLTAGPDIDFSRLNYVTERDHLEFSRRADPERDDILVSKDGTPGWSEANPGGRWRAYGYEELVQRDKCSLDLFWLKDESLEASENLPEPDVIAQEIVEDLRAALEQFEEVASDLARGGASRD